MIDRVLIALLTVVVGGSTIIGGREREEIQSDAQDAKIDVVQVCGEIQTLRDELALLFEPFLDLPSDDQRAHSALQRIVDRLRAPHTCP